MHDRIYDNICQVIGKTPIVRLNRIPKDGWADILVKLESFNPGGSSAATRRLAEQEGILCGISSGAILHASCMVASEFGHGKRVLAILPDTGERYFSTELFS